MMAINFLYLKNKKMIMMIIYSNGPIFLKYKLKNTRIPFNKANYLLLNDFGEKKEFQITIL